MLDASHTATERLDPGEEETEVWHRQNSLIFETRALADYGISDWFSVQLEWPLRIFDTSIRYEDEAGGEVPILGDDIHHRNETLVGTGDPLFGVRVAQRLDDWLFEVRVGGRLPLGQTEENPFTPESLLRPHQHFQLGTGTVDLEIAGAVEYSLKALSVGAWGWSRLTLYENSRGYEAGERLAGGLLAASDLGLEGWRFSALFEVQGELAERWNGVVPTDDGNQGRVDLYAGLGVQMNPAQGLWLALGLRTPVYSRIKGGELEMPVVADLSIGGGFDLRADAEDASAENAGRGDVADFPTGVAPRPVEGRVTVVDYKAVWCGPCRELEVRLVALAERYPEVSVRRFDVGEEAPEGMVLPHVKVYDEEGQLVWESGGSPADLEAGLVRVLDGLRSRP